MQALLMPKPKSAVPKPDGMLSSTKPSMEGLYPVLIVVCSLFYCIVSQEHQIPVEYNASQCMNGMIWVLSCLYL
jgi:hypothetical protein